MGREIRRVPADWKHPMDIDGHYLPLYDESYESACEKWYAKCIKTGGKHVDEDGKSYWIHEWNGNPPKKDYYRDRDWTPKEAICIQMYETVSEGTPVSPVFATKDELIDYLCEHGDFWDQRRRNEKHDLLGYQIPCDPWKRNNAESFVNSGWACSGLMVGGKYYGPSEQGEVK